MFYQERWITRGPITWVAASGSVWIVTRHRSCHWNTVFCHQHINLRYIWSFPVVGPRKWGQLCVVTPSENKCSNFVYQNKITFTQSNSHNSISMMWILSVEKFQSYAIFQNCFLFNLCSNIPLNFWNCKYASTESKKASTKCSHLIPLVCSLARNKGLHQWKAT